jgi:HK97 gp10 family phage protein
MADGLHVKVDGLKELHAAMKELPKAAEGRVLRNALNAGARIIQKDARERAPILAEPRKDREPGRLRRNIVFLRDRASKFAQSVVIGVRASSRRKESDPKNAFYWRFIEFGWTTKSGQHIPARPFLRPAFEAKKHAALAAIKEKMIEGLSKEAAKLWKGTR